VHGLPTSLYPDVSSTIRESCSQGNVNGHQTQAFRQGCPLAPYLFLIVGEYLNCVIKREVGQGRICGIQLPRATESQTIAQFADDTSLSIRGEVNSVAATVETLNRFSFASGLVINEANQPLISGMGNSQAALLGRARTGGSGRWKVTFPNFWALPSG
jgi:hypothetical protein